uniref:Uncharacterized protein n=1 Tax=Haptolina brevifila TaxID=156173 RepID=A0A7S2IN48_9EUKA
MRPLLYVSHDASGRSAWCWHRPRALYDNETILHSIGDDDPLPLTHAQLVDQFAASRVTRQELDSTRGQLGSPLESGCYVCSTRDADAYSLMRHSAQDRYDLWHCPDCQVDEFVEQKRNAKYPEGTRVVLLGLARHSLNGCDATVLKVPEGDRRFTRRAVSAPTCWYSPGRLRVLVETPEGDRATVVGFRNVALASDKSLNS